VGDGQGGGLDVGGPGGHRRADRRLLVGFGEGSPEEIHTFSSGFDARGADPFREFAAPEALEVPEEGPLGAVRGGVERGRRLGWGSGQAARQRLGEKPAIPEVPGRFEAVLSSQLALSFARKR